MAIQADRRFRRKSLEQLNNPLQRRKQAGHLWKCRALQLVPPRRSATNSVASRTGLSPRYGHSFGTPRSVEELAQRPLLLYTYSNTPNELSFYRGDEMKRLDVTGLLESNDGQVLRAAALDGMGILVQPKYILYDDLVAGRLVSVLDDWDLPRLTINVAFQSRRHMSAKVRTFIDFMVDHFDRMDYDRKWSSFDRAFANRPCTVSDV